MGSARIKSVRQRLAYTGGTKYDDAITNLTKDFEGMRGDIVGTGTSSRDKINNIYGMQCTNEATCGKTSGKLMTKLISDHGLNYKQVKVEGGLYTGPGIKNSPAVQKNIGTDEPVLKHEWVKLDDGTIIDGSVGQFINQKGDYSGTNKMRQNQRLRVIRPTDPLYKSYEGRYSANFPEIMKGQRKW